MESARKSCRVGEKCDDCCRLFAQDPTRDLASGNVEHSDVCGRKHSLFLVYGSVQMQIFAPLRSVP